MSQCHSVIIIDYHYEGTTGRTTTVRSDLQNHIEEIRKNHNTRNIPFKTQIKATDLNDYLRVSPIDLKIGRKEKNKNNILDFIKRMARWEDAVKL